MRDLSQSLFAPLAVASTAVALGAAIFLIPDFAFAAEAAKPAESQKLGNAQRAEAKRPAPSAPNAKPQSPAAKPDAPKFRELTTRDFIDAPPVRRGQNQVVVTPRSDTTGPANPASPAAPQPIALDDGDHYAALESVSYALTEVGDGASYVWHRHNGRLSGVVQPKSSFKTSTGQVCRVLTVTLASGTRSKSAEGVACRLSNGQWRLEG